MNRLIILFLILFYSSYSQQGGWSTPVIIDSIRDIGEPLIAVSNKGQIAILGNVSMSPSPLYISNDNGKSFQLQSQFTPDKPIYRFGYPNGLGYDSDGNIWVYWVWHECVDSDCYFFTNTWLYISRSSDSGKTFEYVLKLYGGQHIMTTINHNQWMHIGSDNTVHFLRDSTWYDSAKGTTDDQLIYTRIEQGDPLKRVDVYVPMLPDTSTFSGIGEFILINDSIPIITTRFYNNYFYVNYYHRIISHDNIHSIYDSTLQNLVLGQNGIIHATSVFKKPDRSNIYFLKTSYDNGESFNEFHEITDRAYSIQAADSSYQYSLRWVNPTYSFRYYKYQDLTSIPLDSTYFGAYSYGRLVLDDRGGKYIIARGAGNKSYFIGRDIISKVYADETTIKIDRLKVSLSPNPFNNSTILSFHLPNKSHIDILIYDAIGRKIKSFNNYEAKEGLNKISISGTTLASGTYLIGILYENRLFTVKSQLVK
jgi:hypothetical protein